MGNTVLTPGSILYISVFYHLRFLQSPGGIANIRMTNEFLLFIIPAITAQCISMAVKLFRMGEEHARKATCVESILGLIAVHQMAVMMVSEFPFWARFAVTFTSIGMIVFICGLVILCWAKEGETDKVEKGGLSAANTQA